MGRSFRMFQSNMKTDSEATWKVSKKRKRKLERSRRYCRYRPDPLLSPIRTLSCAACGWRAKDRQCTVLCTYDGDSSLGLVAFEQRAEATRERKFINPQPTRRRKPPHVSMCCVTRSGIFAPPSAFKERLRMPSCLVLCEYMIRHTV